MACDPAPRRGPTDPAFGRRLSIALERTVDAPMEHVWTVLRDYAQARPRILTEHFSDYVVHGGGRGAGTVIGYGLRIGRRRGSYLLVVEEPTPGRQLRERDRSSALVTTWTLTPGGDGERTLMHLAVDLRDRDLDGWCATRHQVTRSPFGADDHIGMLNLVTPTSRGAVLAAADASTAFDLAVEYFVGMPTFSAFGDPGFQIWMSHTPTGTVRDNPAGLGPEQHRLVGWSADCIAMFTHSGTHIDTLNHFGYCREIWNGFHEREHLASRHWTACGADRFPPIAARGVLIDVAALHGADAPPDSYGIGSDDLRSALRRQRSDVRAGDVVLVRTGRMRDCPEGDRYLLNEPGLDRAGAEFPAEAGAIVIDADNVALEQSPSADPENWHPVHTYLLAEAGVPIMENVNLEELSAERVYEFALIAIGMPIRGATAAPMRPLALPLRER